MIYSVNFIDMTLKLDPLAVVKYLIETNWNQYAIKRNDIKIFQYDENNIFEQVTIPLDVNLRDYKNTMYDAICKIAILENKSVEQLMLYLLNPNTDILKIRLEKDDVEQGNIMLDNAINLFNNAKKILAATALDIINPQKTHYGRMDDSVKKFLSQCRFGQTEIGSYVVSVVCPFAELTETGQHHQLSIFSDEERCANSLTRKVTNKLMTNIATVKKKIDNNDFDSLVNYENTISSNFYEALNGLNLQSENTTIEFTAEWSPTVKKNRCEFNKITITNDYYNPIQNIISKIKECDSKRTEIVGKIRHLDASPTIDKRDSGIIKVVYVGDNDKIKTVTAKLSKEDYKNAVTAHNHGKSVKLIGDIQTKNKSFMENVNFSIV